MQLTLALLSLATTVFAGERLYPGKRPVPEGLWKRQGDPQASLTIDPRCINEGSKLTGQEDPTAGQVVSDTSSNNFANLCLKFPNVALTNGEQILEGSYNPIPIGRIPAKNQMPSCKIDSPRNGAIIAPNTTFDVRVANRNFKTGAFTSAQQSYYAAPQKIGDDGILIGHNHAVIDQLDSLDDNKPRDPSIFNFFKGLNDPDQGGILTATVTGGLPEGFYRLCTILTGANHMSAIMPVAQRASLDDCVRFQVTANGGNNGGNAGGNNGANNGGNAGANNGANNGGNAGANNGGDAGANNGGNANAGGNGAANNGTATGGNNNNGQNGGNASAGGAANNGTATGGNNNAGNANNGQNGGNAGANTGGGKGRGQGRNGGGRNGGGRNGGGRNGGRVKRSNLSGRWVRRAAAPEEQEAQ